MTWLELRLGLDYQGANNPKCKEGILRWVKKLRPIKEPVLDVEGQRLTATLGDRSNLETFQILTQLMLPKPDSELEDMDGIHSGELCIYIYGLTDSSRKED